MKKIFSCFAFFHELLPIQTATRAQAVLQYILDKKIDLPGDGGYDYLSIDSINNKLFVSHGNKVDIIDLKSELAGCADRRL